MSIEQQESTSGGQRRAFYSDTLTMSLGEALTDGGGMEDFPGVIDMRRLGGLQIHVPSGFEGDIGFYVSDLPDGTFLPFYDEDDAIVEITVTPGRAYPAPANLYGAHFVKLWAQDAGVDNEQSAAKSITVTGKM